MVPNHVGQAGRDSQARGPSWRPQNQLVACLRNFRAAVEREKMLRDEAGRTGVASPAALQEFVWSPRGKEAPASPSKPYPAIAARVICSMRESATPTRAHARHLAGQVVQHVYPFILPRSNLASGAPRYRRARAAGQAVGRGKVAKRCCNLQGKQDRFPGLPALRPGLCSIEWSKLEIPMDRTTHCIDHWTKARRDA